MIRTICALLVFSSSLLAQATAGSSAQLSPLRKGSSEWGVYLGAGTGFGKRSGTQFLYPGFRYGRVLTHELGKGWYRGNFEAKIQINPFFAVLQPARNAYGVELQPLALHWNFTGNRTVKPYFILSGGLLITNRDVPVNTNHVNFTPQSGMGFHFFRSTRRDRAWTLEAKYLHVSNAGLDQRNSGINASLHATLGYTWFKSPR